MSEDEKTKLGKWMTAAMVYKRRYQTATENMNYMLEAVEGLFNALEQDDPQVIERAVDALRVEYEHATS